jgi:hypothetical protein
MFLFNPKFFALPLAAVLIICALPRAQTPAGHAPVAAQQGVFKVSSGLRTLTF